jgi:hypothetical protein
MALSEDAKKYCEELFRGREAALVMHRNRSNELLRHGLLHAQDAETRVGYYGSLQPALDFIAELGKVRAEAMEEAYTRDHHPLDAGVVEEILTDVAGLLEQVSQAFIREEQAKLDSKQKRSDTPEVLARAKISELARWVNRVTGDTKELIRNHLKVRMYAVDKNSGSGTESAGLASGKAR